MEENKKKHNVLVSACLLGVMCRYNGQGVLDENIEKLMEIANLIPVCPEIMGGLATPREPAERIGEQVLTQTGMDVTAQYKRGANQVLHLAKLYQCPCAVLKERSPSCGYGKIYDGTYTHTEINGDGVTGEVLRSQKIPVFGESQIEAVRTFLDQYVWEEKQKNR